MKVVLSADGTQEGERALEWCIEHLGPGDEVIAVLGMNPVGEFVLSVPPFDTLGSEQQFSQQMNADYGERLHDRGITAQVRVLPHSQERAVIDAAASEHADLIVVGKRPHGAFGDAMRNELAPHLVHRPPCAVVVVPTATTEEVTNTRW